MRHRPTSADAVYSPSRSWATAGMEPDIHPGAGALGDARLERPHAHEHQHLARIVEAREGIEHQLDATTRAEYPPIQEQRGVRRHRERPQAELAHKVGDIGTVGATADRDDAIVAGPAAIVSELPDHLRQGA